MEKHRIATFETYGREPVLRKMADGSLICTFLTGGPTEPHNDNYAAVARSFDGGATWTEPEPLFRHKRRAVWCTELFTEGDRVTAAVHTYNAGCFYRELLTYFSESRDCGRTWSEPVTPRGQINGCSLRQGITLSNGDVLFPLYWQETRAGFEYLGDLPEGAQNWRFCTGVGIRPAGEDAFYRFGYLASDAWWYWEPNAAEVSPGHVVLYFRSSSGRIRISESFDYGRTWSADRALEIPHSDAKITCFTLGGKVFLVNNSVESGRTHLEILRSENGLDFEHAAWVEDPAERWFYPHAAIDGAERTVYLAYENAKEHRLVKYGFDELL